MKQILSLFIIGVFIISCKNETKPTGLFKIDPLIEKDAKAAITEVKDASVGFLEVLDSTYHFSANVNADFFRNDTLEKKILQKPMLLNSWYFWEKGRMQLVVHAKLGHWSANSLYAKFHQDSAEVFFLKSQHEGINIYKVNTSDSLKPYAEVPCSYYDLVVSQLTDTLKKPTVYGHINLASNDFYECYENLAQTSAFNSKQNKLRVNMQFYFKANY